MADQSQDPKTLAEAFAMANRSGLALGERLATYAQYSNTLAPEISTAYERMVSRLSATDWSELGPKVGDQLPPFVLPDHTGHLVALDMLLGRGPLIVSFNRGHWCPYCRMELDELARIEAELTALGSVIVSIQPELEQLTMKQVEERQLPFRILTDLDLAYTLQLGLMCWIGEEIEAIYRERGIDLPAYQGSEGVFLPVPAIFILSRSGAIAARHVDPEFRRRMDPDHLIEEVRKAAAMG